MNQLKGKNILLGVCGGIAAYKTAEVASKLSQMGAAVEVVMTDAAQKFITPLTFESLTRRTVYTSMWQKEEVNPEHIALADRPDLVVIAPATGNTIAKLANGIADNLLTSTLLATKAKILLAPAMNENMWLHPATVKNMDVLIERGVETVGPEDGWLACGRMGQGRMSQPEDIIQKVLELLG